MIIKLNDLLGAKLSNIECKRGLGIVEDYFSIELVCEDQLYVAETESNFRILDGERVILNFNDIYLNLKKNRLSVNMYRKQINIEKSLLQKKIDDFNSKYNNLIAENIILNKYGDLKIYFQQNIIFEIINDTALLETIIFILKKDNAKLIEINNGNFKTYL